MGAPSNFIAGMAKAEECFQTTNQKASSKRFRNQGHEPKLMLLNHKAGEGSKNNH
jgi:hypothetical protein